jgi:HD domain
LADGAQLPLSATVPIGRSWPRAEAPCRRSTPPRSTAPRRRVCWDRGGYPDGLSAEQIPLEARIITCCDSWNAYAPTAHTGRPCPSTWRSPSCARAPASSSIRTSWPRSLRWRARRCDSRRSVRRHLRPRFRLHRRGPRRRPSGARGGVASRARVGSRGRQVVAIRYAEPCVLERATRHGDASGRERHYRLQSLPVLKTPFCGVLMLG